MEKNKTKWGVIFDLDGVVVDTYPWHRKAILEFCKRHQNKIVELNEEMLQKRIFGFPNRTWIPSIFKTPLEIEQIDRLAEEKEKIFRSRIRGSITPLVGLETLLSELERHGVPVAAASSAPPENIALMLTETNLDHYFRVVLDDTSVTQGKPAPEIYLKAAQLIGVPPDHCVVFEDSFVGIEAGRKAGCIVVGVATTHTMEEFPPDMALVINNFNEVVIGTLISLIEKNVT